MGVYDWCVDCVLELIDGQCLQVAALVSHEMAGVTSSYVADASDARARLPMAEKWVEKARSLPGNETVSAYRYQCNWHEEVHSSRSGCCLGHDA